MENSNESQRTADSRSRSGPVPAGYWKKPALFASIAAAIVLGVLLFPQIQEMQTSASDVSSEMKTEQWVVKIRSLLDQVDHAGAERQIQEFRIANPDYDLNAALFNTNTDH